MTLSATPPATVDSVDLTRYVGKWYEIARYPQWFERGMTHVTAEYIPEEKHIRVINSGISDGKRKVAKGKAFVVPGSGNACLKVQFFWPFKGDYRIIGLAPDYSWAIVSNRKRSTLWILSRTPAMDPDLKDELLGKLARDGFDLNRIEFTKQD